MNEPGHLLCKVALIYHQQNIMISVYISIFKLLQVYSINRPKISIEVQTLKEKLKKKKRKHGNVQNFMIYKLVGFSACKK